MTDWDERRKEWQDHRSFNRILERSSLAHENLYGWCIHCNKEQARDPDTDYCVLCQCELGPCRCRPLPSI
jgi:hypothetical protein